jgi:hypothetical protein
MLFGLHGTSAIKVLIIVSLNYLLAKKTIFMGKAAPVAYWTFNIAVLFLNEWFGGYKFGNVHESFEWLVRGSLQGCAVVDALAGWMDRSVSTLARFL